MPWNFFKSTRNAYEPLQSTEGKNEDGHIMLGLRQASQPSTLLVVLLAAFIALSSGTLGFFLGRNHEFLSNSTDKDGTSPQYDSFNAQLTLPDFLPPSGNIDYPMIYNITYTKEPTPETNAAWNAMFPSQQTPTSPPPPFPLLTHRTQPVSASSSTPNTRPSSPVSPSSTNSIAWYVPNRRLQTSNAPSPSRPTSPLSS